MKKLIPNRVTQKRDFINQAMSMEKPAMKEKIGDHGGFESVCWYVWDQYNFTNSFTTVDIIMMEEEWLSGDTDAYDIRYKRAKQKFERWFKEVLRDKRQLKIDIGDS